MQASGNVAGLCNWAAAMVKYHEVAVMVEPKIVTLRGAEGELRAATKEQHAALALLAVVQGNLDAMQVRTAPCDCTLRHVRPVWRHDMVVQNCLLFRIVPGKSSLVWRKANGPWSDTAQVLRQLLTVFEDLSQCHATHVAGQIRCDDGPEEAAGGRRDSYTGARAFPGCGLVS